LLIERQRRDLKFLVSAWRKVGVGTYWQGPRLTRLGVVIEQCSRISRCLELDQIGSLIREIDEDSLLSDVENVGRVYIFVETCRRWESGIGEYTEGWP
jgi:hypothetical protein